MKFNALLTGGLILVQSLSFAQAQDNSGFIESAARVTTDRIQKEDKAFTDSLGAEYPDKLATKMILRHQYVKTIEWMRIVADFPDALDSSKRFDLPNLQAALILYNKSKNCPLPDDLQQIRKNAALALTSLIKLKEDAAERRASNPDAPIVDHKKEQEEEKMTMALTSQYDTYGKQMEDVTRTKYGIDPAMYNSKIAPVLRAAVTSVSNSFSTPEEKKNAVNRLFDKLVGS